MCESLSTRALSLSLSLSLSPCRLQQGKEGEREPGFEVFFFPGQAIFILEPHNTSGQLCSLYNSSQIKTGERRITRLQHLNRLVRLLHKVISLSPIEVIQVAWQRTKGQLKYQSPREGFEPTTSITPVGCSTH